MSGIDGGNPLYMSALRILDGDMNQYVQDNTDDELSHAPFLNASLKSKGERAVDLDRFRTLPCSRATGAHQIGRLSNLTQLTVGARWRVRYCSTTNPDLGATFLRAEPSLAVRPHTAIPRSDADTAGSTITIPPQNGVATCLQAIAFTAGFHFVFIEQGGASLCHTLTQKVASLELLRIVVSIGGSEVMHFQTWQDKAGNALPLTFFDPINKSTVTFEDLTTNQPQTLQANLIMPEPCDFISKNLPPCAIIRPNGPGQIDAQGAINSFIVDGLFIGQSKEFIQLILHLAREADKARREAQAAGRILCLSGDSAYRRTSRHPNMERKKQHQGRTLTRFSLGRSVFSTAGRSSSPSGPLHSILQFLNFERKAIRWKVCSSQHTCFLL